MKAIFQFENHENVAKRFRLNHLEPRLLKADLLRETTIEFQDYLDRGATAAPVFPPAQVASLAYRRWDSLSPAPEKTAWVLDLSATSSTTPDSSYGLCVLLALANQFGGSIEDFLNRDSFLAIVLTLFPAQLHEDDGVGRLLRPSCDLRILDRLWPRVKKVRNENPSRVVPQEIERAIGALGQPGPRVVLANSGNDDSWLAELIASWFK